MAFKGLKKPDGKQVNHFDRLNAGEITIGRPPIDGYKKQDKRIQFYISQEMIDVLLPIAVQNGCKDVTAYAKKILTNEFEINRLK